jgi:peptidoglycan-associated lipoprotein
MSPERDKEGLTVRAKRCGMVFLAVLVIIGLGACSTSKGVTKSQTPAAASVAPATPQNQAPQMASGSADKVNQLKKDGAVASADMGKGRDATAVVLKDIYFDFDKYLIGTEAANVLKENSRWFTANPAGRLRVEGNCDERGTIEYNLALGQKRADAARSYLVTLGVDGKKIETVSYGKEKPADPSKTPEAWAKNRRDHFIPLQ